MCLELFFTKSICLIRIVNWTKVINIIQLSCLTSISHSYLYEPPVSYHHHHDHHDHHDRHHHHDHLYRPFLPDMCQRFQRTPVMFEHQVSHHTWCWSENDDQHVADLDLHHDGDDGEYDQQRLWRVTYSSQTRSWQRLFHYRTMQSQWTGPSPWSAWQWWQWGSCCCMSSSRLYLQINASIIAWIIIRSHNIKMQVHLISLSCNCQEFAPADLRLWGVFHTQTLVFYTCPRKVVLPCSKLMIIVIKMIMICKRTILCEIILSKVFTYVNPTELCSIENMRHSWEDPTVKLD